MERRGFLQLSVSAGVLSLVDIRKSARTFVGTVSLASAYTHYQDYITPEVAIVERFASEAEVTDAEIRFPGDPEFEYVTDPERDGVGYWQTPQQYYEHSFRGDCEDYAFFFSSVLEAMGYDTRVVFGLLDREAHALTEFYTGDGYAITGVTDPKTVTSRSTFRDVARWRPVAMFGVDTAWQPYDPQW